MKRKDILLILVPSFIFVVLWTVFSIYHGFITSTISEVLNIQISPISPNFDTQTVSSLKARQIIQPIFEINPGQSGSETLEASDSATTTNPSVENSEDSESTSGGNLSE